MRIHSTCTIARPFGVHVSRVLARTRGADSISRPLKFAVAVTQLR